MNNTVPVSHNWSLIDSCHIKTAAPKGGYTMQYTFQLLWEKVKDKILFEIINHHIYIRSSLVFILPLIGRQADGLRALGEHEGRQACRQAMNCALLCSIITRQPIHFIVGSPQISDRGSIIQFTGRDVWERKEPAILYIQLGLTRQKVTLQRSVGKERKPMVLTSLLISLKLLHLIVRLSTLLWHSSWIQII